MADGNVLVSGGGLTISFWESNGKPNIKHLKGNLKTDKCRCKFCLFYFFLFVIIIKAFENHCFNCLILYNKL